MEYSCTCKHSQLCWIACCISGKSSLCAVLKDVLHGALLMGWSALGGGVRFGRSVRALLGAEGLEQQAPHCCFALSQGTSVRGGMLCLYPDSHLLFWLHSHMGFHKSGPPSYFACFCKAGLLHFMIWWQQKYDVRQINLLFFTSKIKFCHYSKRAFGSTKIT